MEQLREVREVEREREGTWRRSHQPRWVSEAVRGKTNRSLWWRLSRRREERRGRVTHLIGEEFCEEERAKVSSVSSSLSDNTMTSPRVGVPARSMNLSWSSRMRRRFSLA
jgi:hypothetical protein